MAVSSVARNSKLPIVIGAFNLIIGLIILILAALEFDWENQLLAYYLYNYMPPMMGGMGMHPAHQMSVTPNPYYTQQFAGMNMAPFQQGLTGLFNREGYPPRSSGWIYAVLILAFAVFQVILGLIWMCCGCYACCTSEPAEEYLYPPPARDIGHSANGGYYSRSNTTDPYSRHGKTVVTLTN